jgi:uncharacterized protein (DUF433 family)
MALVDKNNVVISAYSIDHAARVTGLSKTRLVRWDKLGFFSPEYLDENDRGNPYSRVYSFVDLVGLRTLAVLTEKYRIPQAELARAAAELKKRASRPWSEIPLAVVKKKVVFDLNTTPRDTDGQHILKHIPLTQIAQEVKNRAADLRNRNSALHGSTERHKYIAHNAIVLAGTRIPVKAIESFIKAGYSDDEILKEYPSLTKTDIQFVRLPPKVAA